MTQKQLAIAIEEWLGERKPGEWELKRYLRKQGYEVEDVSDNPSYWYKDIDLIVNSKTTLEVKWDSRISKTGNIFLEICSNVEKNQPGWFKFCKADYLFYGNSIDEEFYVFNFKELKAHIKAHKDEYQQRTAPDYNKYGEITKRSIGYVVPLESLQGLYKTISIRGLY